MSKRTPKSEAVDPTPRPEHDEHEAAPAPANAAAEPDDAGAAEAAAPEAPEATPEPVIDVPFKRDPRCDEQKRHVAWCGCQGEARGPIA